MFIASDGAIAEKLLVKQRKTVNKEMKKFHDYYKNHEYNKIIKPDK